VKDITNYNEVSHESSKKFVYSLPSKKKLK